MDEPIWKRKENVSLEEILDEMIEREQDYAEDVPYYIFESDRFKPTSLCYDFRVIVMYKGEAFVCESREDKQWMEDIYYIRRMDVIEL